MARKIEDRESYKDLVYLLEFIKTAQPIKILRKIVDIIDGRNGYHSQTASSYVYESLELLEKQEQDKALDIQGVSAVIQASEVNCGK